MSVTAILAAWVLLAPLAVRAQSASLKGRVLTDSAELPIPGVVVAIADLKLQATTDSTGAFMIPGIKPGAYIVTARKIGLGPLATRIRFGAKEVLDADLLLTPNVTALPDVTVKAKAPVSPHLAEFEERRATGAGGHFLTQDVFDKRTWSWTADVLRSNTPGIELMRDGRRPSSYYVVGGRLQVPGGALANGGSKPPPCFAAVVLDGAFVYQGNPGETPFDINSISPGAIAGMEVYASTASIPAKYNGTRGTCGLVLIWTR